MCKKIFPNSLAWLVRIDGKVKWTLVIVVDACKVVVELKHMVSPFDKYILFNK